MSKQIGKDVLIGIVDYEKAFDYTNKYLLTKTLTDNGIGKRFLKTVANSYETTDYIIKTSPNTIGNSISTDHGVTQGKTTSADYFSCFVSDMGSSLVNSSHTNDFMDPFSLLQLADDTTVTADNLQSFTSKMDLIARYSQEKYLKIHPSKSKYLHITDHAPMSVDIVINEGLALEPLEDLGYNWLGFWLCQSNVIPDIINFHFNKKIIHVSTFYYWLDVNRDTPIKIKIVVLYNCLFASLLYSCEVWGEIGDKLAEKILKVGKKALKPCLGVKISTPDDVIYSELNKADILTDRQYKFFNKFISLDASNAISRCIWNVYSNLVYTNTPNLYTYYSNLQPDNKIRNILERKTRLVNSTLTMTSRYRQLFNLRYCENLYSSFVNERDRLILTRWRLSCHQLRIETGRYERPPVPRDERLCTVCFVLEGETHTLFHCKCHIFIRHRRFFIPIQSKVLLGLHYI